MSPALHATGTAGGLASSELNRDLAGVQGTFGWSTQSGAVTFSSGLQFAVAAIAAGDYTVNSVTGAVYAGGNVTLSTQDPSLPRIDIIVITSAGAVSAVAGVPAAQTTSTGPIPPTPSTSQLEIARIYVPASGTSLSASSITDRRHPLTSVPTALTLSGLTKKYKTATQVFTTNTTYADVIAAGSPATMSFTIAASEVWEVEYWVPLAFGGTGGAKFQITGPSAPTGVNITGDRYTSNNSALGAGQAVKQALTPVTAFSSDIAAFSSSTAATASITNYPNDAPDAPIHIRARIINGANAGTVTLQAAQNSSNSTTTLGLGSYMRAERVA